jgi:hypothetical protein
LALLGAVDTAEADRLRVMIVEDFDGIAIEDGNDGAGKASDSHNGKIQG